MNQGKKYDGGKDRWDLYPTDSARQVVKVLTYSAVKYGDRNWETGLKWSRYYAATMRHLTAWWEREENDVESGLSHLAHAACNLTFLLAYIVRGSYTHLDDRPGKACPGASLGVGGVLATLPDEPQGNISPCQNWPSLDQPTDAWTREAYPQNSSGGSEARGRGKRAGECNPGSPGGVLGETEAYIQANPTMARLLSELTRQGWNDSDLGYLLAMVMAGKRDAK